MATFKFYYSRKFDFDSIDGFHLLQDHVGTYYGGPWNDYDYIVTFQIHRVLNGERKPFGHTKILVKGFQNTSDYFLAGGKPNGNSFEISTLFSPNKVISLASELEYYRRIRHELGGKASDFLRDLCDASYYYHLKDEYIQWPGFTSSIFRNSVAKAALKKGNQVAQGSYTPEEQFDFKIIGMEEDFEPITFSFNNKRKLGSTNINLLIGKNGSGKSHILRHVVDLLTGVVESKESTPYFHKVIVAAYSPFESFKTENEVFNELNIIGVVEDPEKSQELLEQMERRRLLVNEYAYLGFKDVNGKFSIDWPKESSARALIKILAYDNENMWWDEDSRFSLLVETLSNSIDFDEVALSTKDGNLVRFSKNEKFSREKFKDTPDYIDHAAGIKFLRKSKASEDTHIVSLSSGQIIYSYLLPSLVAEVDDESLLILDEPELYLHPAMEVALINMIKKLLEATNSNAIIATHSAILAREVERRGISILRRDEEATTVSPPTFETFGQSAELIIGEAFDDYRVKKAYEKSLDIIANKYKTPQDAIVDLRAEIGDGALAYLASKVNAGSKIDVVQIPDNEINIKNRSEEE